MLLYQIPVGSQILHKALVVLSHLLTPALNLLKLRVRFLLGFLGSIHFLLELEVLELEKRFLLVKVSNFRFEVEVPRHLGSQLRPQLL